MARATAIGAAVLLTLALMGYAADVAIIDYADQWTQVEALGPSLEELGIKFDDITADVEGGKFDLAGYKLFFICSMATNNQTIHRSLDDNEKVIHSFVQDGGIVIEPTQADQNEANVDWLPDDLTCVRSDPDLPTVEIVEPDHPLFNTPNKLKEDDFLNWRYKGWPTVWEVIATQSGFDVLAKSGSGFVILEAEYGKGKFVMMSLAPDKYHVAGNDDHTKKQAFLFLENLVHAYYLDLTPVEPGGKLGITWGEIKRRM
jgi:hypothetical protein